MVPEGRRLFPSLSVEENLLIGGLWRAGRRAAGPSTAVYELFPILARAAPQPAHRAFRRPAADGGDRPGADVQSRRVLLCDEISLGLAPVVIRDIYAALPRIRASGAAIVVVEQDIGQALEVADRVYCMMEGRITLAGAPAR